MLLHLRDKEDKLVILEVDMIYYNNCVLNTTGDKIGCVVLETATNRTFAIPMNKEAYEQIFSCITYNHVYSINGVKGIVLNTDCEGNEYSFIELLELNRQNNANINSDTVQVGIFDLTKG